MSNVTFRHDDYRLILPHTGDVVYCDPPYADTTGYRDAFDSKAFWETMDSWHELGADVFVSEYQAPPHWECVYAVERARPLKSRLTNSVRVTEKLFARAF